MSLIVLTTICNAQTFKNFVKVSEYKGDFNSDNQTDKIVLFEKVCENLNSTGIKGERCRRLAIYMKKNKSFVLFAFNDYIIQCSGCGGGGVGDPFRDIKIKNNFISVESLYGGCDKTFEVITFKFDKKVNDFYLYKIGTENYSCREEANPNGEIKSTKTIRTKKDFGKVTFKAYNL